MISSRENENLEDSRSSQHASDGRTTIIVSPTPKHGFFEQALPSLFAGLPGVVVALLATYLGHVYSQRRESERARVEREEAIRKESNSKRIDALEKLTERICGISQDLTRWSTLAINPNSDNSCFDDQSNMNAAKTMATLYFLNRLNPEWMTYESIYFETRCLVPKIRLTAHDLSRSQGNVPEQERILAAQQKHLHDYEAGYKKAIDAQSALFAKIENLMPELTPMPDRKS